MNLELEKEEDFDRDLTSNSTNTQSSTHMHNSFYKGKKPFTKKEKEAAADREALTAYREQKKEYKSYHQSTTPLPKPKSYLQ